MKKVAIDVPENLLKIADRKFPEIGSITKTLIKGFLATLPRKQGFQRFKELNLKMSQKDIDAINKVDWNKVSSSDMGTITKHLEN